MTSYCHLHIVHNYGGGGGGGGERISRSTLLFLDNRCLFILCCVCLFLFLFILKSTFEELTPIYNVYYRQSDIKMRVSSPLLFVRSHSIVLSLPLLVLFVCLFVFYFFSLLFTSLGAEEKRKAM